MALGKSNCLTKIGHENVECTSLDTLVGRLKLRTVGAIKIDVEGKGYDVIMGGLNTIIMHKPVIFFEVHNAEERKAIKMLSDLGWHIISKPGDMYIALPRSEHAIDNKSFTKLHKKS